MKFRRRLGIIFIALLTALVIWLMTNSSDPGQLRVGFDIDDTVLFSRAIFVNLPPDKRNPIDFGWVNVHDWQYSLLIEPMADLIHFYRAHGHRVYFITARPGINGDSVALFLTKQLGFPVIKGKNLFFEPKENVGDYRYTTKHRQINKLGLDIFYGDSDTDIVAAIKAGVQPVRVVRHQSSINQYGKNYFGDTTDGTTQKAPFSANDLQKFYRGYVGMFGESIYPLIWDGPPSENGPE
ncbi:MAG: hypothetical protein HQ562_09710 [Candidatus Marinimicrobia bacterium]|nr:hypothetical protein [Candidatus Neomarinimicrobiota bacterium]